MKHSLLLCCILALAMLACKQNPQQPQTNPNDGPILVDCELLGKRLVPIVTAQRWIDNYNKFRDSLQYKESGIGGPPRAVDATAMSSAFTFQTMDLLSALGIKGDFRDLKSQHVRGYLGKDDLGNSKMLIVGVLGADTRDSSKMTAGMNLFFQCSSAQRNNAELYALDLNYPCPNLCPETFVPDAGKK